MNAKGRSLTKKELEDKVSALEQELERIKNHSEGTFNHSISYLSELVPLGFWEYVIKEDKVYWSEKAYEIYGRKKGDPITFKTINDSILPEDRELHSDTTRKWIKGGNCIPFEYRIETPDGSLKYLEARGRVERDKKGDIIKLIGAVMDVTSQKEGEQRLKVSHEQLEDEVDARTVELRASKKYVETIIKEVPIVLFATDKEGIFTFSDGKGLKGLGLKPQQVVGKSAFELYNDFEDIINSIHKALRGEEVHVTNQLGEVYFDSTFTPLFDENQKVTGLVGVSVDVTEAVAFDKKIAQSNRLLRQAQKAAHLGGWEMDIDSMQINWSREVYKIFGLDPGTREPLEDLKKSVFHPEDWQLISRLESEAISNASSYSVECRIIRPGGELRYIHAQAEVIGDEKGKPKSIVGSYLDITERIKSEIQVRESEAKFRKITDHTPLAIYMSSGVDQRAEYTNNTFTNYFGYTLDEVPSIEEWWPKAYPDPAYRKKIEKEWQRKVVKAIKEKTEIEPLQAEVTCKDGTKKLIIWYFISDGDKNWAFGQDITDRYKAEHELKESEERYKRVIDSSNTGIWEWDLQEYNVYFSPRWKSILGYEDHEMENKFEIWQNHLHPDDSERIYNDLDAFLKNPVGKFEKQFRMRHKDGSYIWIQNRSSVHFDDHGDPLIMSGSHQDITKIKDYEAEIRKSENKFRDIFNNISECILIITFEGEIVEFNKSTEVQYGYTRAEFMELSPYDLIRPDYHDSFNRFQEDLRTMGTFEGETIDLRKDGTEFYTSVKGSVIEYDSKPHLMAVIRDISIRKIAEIDLADAYEFNELVLKNSQLGILTYDSSGQCVSANEAAAKVVGTSNDLLMKQNLHEIASWKDSGLYDLALDTMKTGEPNQDLLHVLTSWKKDVYIDSYTSRFYKKDQEHLLLIINDVTEKEAARQDRDRFFNTTLALLCTASLDGYFLEMNPAWEDTLGYSHTELKSHKFIDFIHPDDVDSTLETVKDLGNGKRAVNFINRYKCKDDTYKYLSWSSVCYDDTIYASAIDITPIEEYKFQLEKQAIELSRSNQELEQFAYVASHDLQEPLRKIKNYTQMLGRNVSELLDDKTRGYMESIDNAVLRMQNLINDLLSYSRVSSRGKDFVVTDLSDLIKEVEQIMELSIHKSNAELKINKLPTVFIDEGQIIQLLQNLISNAIKFNDKDRPRINIGTHSQDKTSATIFVRDNGIGIESQYQEKVFTIFQRLHHRDHYEGTGIGLSICKKIAGRHGGRIWFESTPGEGTIFYVTLPKQPK